MPLIWLNTADLMYFLLCQGDKVHTRYTHITTQTSWVKCTHCFVVGNRQHNMGTLLAVTCGHTSTVSFEGYLQSSTLRSLLSSEVHTPFSQCDALLMHT